MRSDEKRPVAENIGKNGILVGKIRQKLYAHLLNRIKESIANEYYLEAIALEESFISDRLESYCTHKGTIRQSKLELGHLLDHVKDGVFSPDLRKKLWDWRQGRNDCLHEMAKFGIVETPTWDEKMNNAKIFAECGIKLVRETDKELRRLKSLDKKSK